VDDDGPGLEASMREAVLQRDVRADEAGPDPGSASRSCAIRPSYTADRSR
jgi:hypothetical protein